MGTTGDFTFSIVMPVYNHAEYIGDAVASVIAQTFTDWELWIVDDGSTDGSGAVADQWAGSDERIGVIHQANAGPAAARNAGVAAGRGPWLAFLDSDDVYFPNTLERFAAAIRNDPSAGFFYGYRHRLNDDDSVTELPGEAQQGVTTAADLFERMYLSTLCVCCRRDLLETVGGFDERLRSLEDYDLYLRMGPHTSFTPLGEPTGLRRRHATNISRQSGHSRMVQGAVLRRYLDRYSGHEAVGTDRIARRLGKVYYAAGREYFKKGCFAEAADALAIAETYRMGLKGRLLSGAARLLRPLSRRDGRQCPDL